MVITPSSRILRASSRRIQYSRSASVAGASCMPAGVAKYVTSCRKRSGMVIVMISERSTGITRTVMEGLSPAGHVAGFDVVQIDSVHFERPHGAFHPFPVAFE